jgi:lipopolysaccharide biosynthesis protein
MTNVSILRHGKSSSSISNDVNLDLREDTRRAAETVFCVHVFYADLIDEIAQFLEMAKAYITADTVLTLPAEWSLKDITFAIELIKPVRVILVKNVGRDVWPFLLTLKEVRALGYEFGCKIHSKKSPHLRGGGHWRTSLLRSLLSESAIESVMSRFHSSSAVGLLGPKGSRGSCKDTETIASNRVNMELISRREGLPLHDAADFIVGTMFWFRIAAFSSLNLDLWHDDDFDEELGQSDGTLAHAFERLFPLIAEQSKFRLEFYDALGGNNPYRK